MLTQSRGILVRGYFSIGRRKSARAGQTLLEYALLIALISLITVSALEEVGIHVKGAAISTSCALIWAQHNVAGGNETEINNAMTEIVNLLNSSLDGMNPGERAMKLKIMDQQVAIKRRYLGGN